MYKYLARQEGTLRDGRKQKEYHQEQLEIIAHVIIRSPFSCVFVPFVLASVRSPGADRRTQRNHEGNLEEAKEMMFDVLVCLAQYVLEVQNCSMIGAEIITAPGPYRSTGCGHDVGKPPRQSKY